MTRWLHDVYGLLGCSLLVMVMLSPVVLLGLKSKGLRRVFLGVGFLLTMIPFDGTSLAELVRGVTGDIAIPTFFLCLVVVRKCLNSPRVPMARQIGGRTDLSPFSGGTVAWFFLIVLVVGAVFYPMTLGFSELDPYAWGYAPRGMLGFCACLTVALEYLGQRTAAIMILLSMAAYAARLMESGNLWDYLLDPALFLTSVVGCIVVLLRRTWGIIRTESHAKSGI